MKRTVPVARLVVSVVALGAVAFRTDFRSLIDVVGGADLSWILVAIMVNLIAVCGSVLLWRAMMDRREVPPLWFLMRTYFAGLFVNNIGLGTVMGDSMRTVELAQHQRAPIHRAAVSMLAERALSLVSLCVLASLGAAFVVQANTHLAYGVWATTGAVLFGFVAMHQVGGYMERVTLLPRAGRALVQEIRDALATLVRSPLRMAHGIALALCIQLCSVFAAMAVTRSLGAGLGLWEALAVVAVIALFVQLPVSVQGIGVREGSYVLLFGMVGLSPEVAVSAALISFATTLLVSMIGGLVLLERMLSRRDSVPPVGDEQARFSRVA